MSVEKPTPGLIDSLPHINRCHLLYYCRQFIFYIDFTFLQCLVVFPLFDFLIALPMHIFIFHATEALMNMNCVYNRDRENCGRETDLGWTEGEKETEREWESVRVSWRVRSRVVRGFLPPVTPAYLGSERALVGKSQQGATPIMAGRCWTHDGIITYY